MNRFFYVRLALQNIRKNGKFYFPYLITGALIVAMFYNMIYAATNPGMAAIDSFAAILMLGSIVVGIFSVIFILYTNSFLMKRRQKELGLYNILGMEKHHIGRIMLWETVFTCFITVLGGLLIGILLSKLLMLLVFRLILFTVHYGFTVSALAVIVTVILFCGIYFLALLYNLRRVHQSKPIELLHGGEVGEREPKVKWPLVVIGLLSLGSGYAIALIVKSPLQALALFFVAVVLVIIGTYCLFTAGSIALLKGLRRNKKYYYQTKHFTGVSGMLYRMKKNAVGLANVCILCTMVLVTVSTTVCTYVGVEDALKNAYPADIQLQVNLGGAADAEPAAFRSDVQKIVEKHGLSITKSTEFSSCEVYLSQEGNTLRVPNKGANPVSVTLLTAAQYANLTGLPCNLASNEVLLYTNSEHIAGDEIKVAGESYHIKARLQSVPIITNELSIYIRESYCIVLPNAEALQKVRDARSSDGTPSRVYWKMYADLTGTEDQKQECYRNITEQLAGQRYSADGTRIPDGAENGASAANAKTFGKSTASTADAEDGSYYLSMYNCRAAERANFYTLYGSLLFVGIFLGFLFLLGTVLIIYYKQISEGYEDKERFEIMQKVGMTHSEVRESIRGQILIVFFLPLAAALIHLAAAFKMITRLLVVLNLTNVGLFAICTLITMAVFALVYAVVYAVTARTYYRIVES